MTEVWQQVGSLSKLFLGRAPLKRMRFDELLVVFVRTDLFMFLVESKTSVVFWLG